MEFDWNNYFKLAEELAQRNEEAAKRTAISRAYYSAFHDAMARAEKNCGPKQGGNSHEWCWNKYYLSRNDDCTKLAIDGNRLKAQRVEADYTSDTDVRLDDNVTRALGQAKKL